MKLTDKVNEIDVLSILTAICRLLSRDPLKLDDVRPELAALPLTATVEPEPGTDIPASVRLALPASSQLTLEALQEDRIAALSTTCTHLGWPQ